ncbi:hypothetical protein [Hyphomonas pacifica]|uniref:DUF8051 domain-containing protein n=1 Tax=Hyphomonas pacifica TaxID=1280941 RepID=A0A062TZ62_9PROT|nr:hypothetical protein [Hyphomonas pacifica]KCZ50783.1 hypothetical protein HY2_02710 [Hyphomonas pacifica]RAN34488.1 hypothetical protein HY3_10980 [Hyphomonas pacifica]RAN35001.1 hypothetical protein HY11_03110 [Hyphomonas pacifica]
MRKPLHWGVVALLVASAANLCVMVPGGPIEERDFSAISPVILGSFNLFLTLLGLSSFALAYLIASKRYSGYILASLIGLGYFAVYALDLTFIFPKSPTPMPALLFKLEWLGIFLSVPLILGAALMSKQHAQNGHAARGAIFSMPAILGAGVLILAIVTFSTYSAMGL